MDPPTPRTSPEADVSTAPSHSPRHTGDSQPACLAASRRQFKSAFAFAAVTLVVAPFAYMSMFSGFRLYDDEGFFLVTLRDYLSGHPLLSPYVPLYGPFFYEVMGGLYKVLGLEPGHDNGRFVTVVVWLLCSVAGGLATLRLTRNLWLGLGAQVVSFTVLTALSDEPSSTYGLTSLLLQGLILAAAFKAKWPRATAAIIGGTVGALFLIKINVGAFAALAVAFAWACSLPRRGQPLAAALTGALLVIFPPVLMRDFLNRDWVMEFAVLAALSAAGLGLAAVLVAPPRLPAPSARWLVAGGGMIVTITLGVALVGGTTLADAANMLAVSFHYPGVFVIPLTTGVLYDAWAVVSVIAAFLLLRRLSRDGMPGAVVALVRVGAGLFTLLLLLTLPEPIFLFALPLVWLAAVPPRQTGGDPTDAYARLLLPALAVMESLQAYPVAGSQTSLAALALVPVGAICLNDGLRELRAMTEIRSVRFTPVTWVAPMVLVINVAVFLLSGIGEAARFKTATPLGLPGAQAIRLAPDQATQIRAMVAAVDLDCSSFITLPGMDSFYLWTEQQPPTPLRYELWWLTVDRSQTSPIVKELELRPRVCVVKCPAILDFWLEGRQLPNDPLIDFIDRDFVDGGSYGACELLVRS